MQNCQNNSQLLLQLNKIPSAWQLTPVNGKAPYINHWNKANGFVSREQITTDIKLSKATGYGALSGIHSAGLLFVDIDGASALRYVCQFLKINLPSNFDFNSPTAFSDVLELEVLPETISWYSGKPGRGQLAFQVPKHWWGCLQARKIPTGQDEALEIHWGGRQSVLPPSIHPDTGAPYMWGASPDESTLACITSCEPLARLAIGTQRPTSNTDKAIAHLWGLADIRYDDYDQWKAVGMALKYEADNGGDAGKLSEHWHVWSAQSDKYDEWDAEHKWESFKGASSGNNITVASLIDWSKEDDWESPWDYYDVPKNKPKFQNTKTDYLNNPDFKADIDAYIQAGLDNTAKIHALKKLSEKHFITNYDLQDYISATVNEQHELDTDPYLKSDIEKLLNYIERDINVEDYLPEKLAYEIKAQATRRAINQAPYLFTLIAAVSAFMKVGTRVQMKKRDDFSTPINFFVMLLGSPSSGKSEVLNTMFTKPIVVFKERFDNDFTKAKAKYEADKKNYDQQVKDKSETLKENFPKGNPKNSPAPRERTVFITNTTVEAIWRQFQAHPTRGILLYYHELPALFKSADQYKNGKGNDSEEIMNAYDCAPKNIIRVQENTSYSLHDGTQLSIAGAIQHEPLKMYYGDGSDPNGKNSRWVIIPVHKTTTYDDPNVPDIVSDNPGEDSPLTAILKELYLALDEIPKYVYTLSSKAYSVYIEASNSFKRQIVESSNNGLIAYLGKCDKQVGTYAAILHILHHICRTPNEPMNTMISETAMKAAVELTNFTIDKQKYVFQSVLNVGNEQHTAELTNIVQLSKTKDDWITVRDVTHSLNAYKKSKRPEIEKLFKKLERLKRGRTRIINNKMEYHWSRTGISPDPSPTNTPGSSPDPSPTNTPGSSPDPSPTNTPGSSPDPSPTNTPGSSPDPSPTNTPGSSPDPSPTNTPGSSPDPSPTNTPGSSPDPSPTNTPGSSPDPSPTNTPGSSPDPSPTNTPGSSPDLNESDNFWDDW